MWYFQEPPNMSKLKNNRVIRIDAPSVEEMSMSDDEESAWVPMTKPAVHSSFFWHHRKVSRFKAVWIIVLIYIAVFLSSAADLFGVYNLYDARAEEKGLTALQINVVTWVWNIGVPVATFGGIFIAHFGSKYLFVSSIFLLGGSAVLTGVLDKGPGGTPLFVMSLFLLTSCGIGSFVSTMAAMTIITTTAPQWTAALQGLLLTCRTAGSLLVGIHGNDVLQYFDYTTSFVIFGSIAMGCSVFAFCCLPSISDMRPPNNVPLGNIMKIPAIYVNLLMVLASAWGMGFMPSAWSYRLNQMNGTTSLQIDAINVSGTVLIMVLSPIIGFVSDKYPRAGSICVAALAMMVGLTIWFVGPVQFLPMSRSVLAIPAIFMTFHQVSSSALHCIAFGKMVTCLRNYTTSFDESVTGLLSALYVLVYRSGNILGEQVGDMLIGKYGLPTASTIVGCIPMLLALMYAIFKVLILAPRWQFQLLRTEDDPD